MLINRFYSPIMNDPVVLPGDFSSIKLIAIINYEAAVKLDNNVVSLMETLGYTNPNDETFYHFVKNDITFILCEAWIDPNSMSIVDTHRDRSYNVKHISNLDHQVITNWLNSMGYKYTIG